MNRPPDQLTHASVTLRRWRADDAELSFQLIRESLDHLAPWMPWATPDYSLDESRDYCSGCEVSWAEGTAFQYLVLADGSPAGSAGLMARTGPGGLEIGYWVHPAYTGRGVATSAAAALTEAGLALPGIDRIEIVHDARNIASQRVPEKLGYAHAENRLDKHVVPVSEPGDTKVWRITR
jgi:RimJ/RimL family protein N-acetyltransferase